MKLIRNTIKTVTAAGAAAAVIAAVADHKENKNSHVARGVYEAHIKRPLDAFLATSAAVALSPVMLGTAVLVRLKLGSPVLFRQDRPGRDEKIFRLYKFRTMTEAKDAEGNLLSDEERLTSFGKLLRSTSLDELPELLNIIKGDMAVVGPRPLLVRYLPRYNETQKRRHEVRPGLTGLAAAEFRNTGGWERKLALDVEYVDNITFMNDLKIILKTVGMVLGRKDINESGEATASEFMGTGAGTVNTAAGMTADEDEDAGNGAVADITANTGGGAP